MMNPFDRFHQDGPDAGQAGPVWRMSLVQQARHLYGFLLTKDGPTGLLHFECRQRYSSKEVIVRLERAMAQHQTPLWLLAGMEEFQHLPGVIRWASGRGINVGLLPTKRPRTSDFGATTSRSFVRSRPTRRFLWDEATRAAPDDLSAHADQTSTRSRYFRTPEHEPRMEQPAVRIQGLCINEVTVMADRTCVAIGRAFADDAVARTWTFRFSAEILLELLQALNLPSYDPFVRKILNGFKPGVRRFSKTLRAHAADVTPEREAGGAEVMRITKLYLSPQ